MILFLKKWRIAKHSEFYFLERKTKTINFYDLGNNKKKKMKRKQNTQIHCDEKHIRKCVCLDRIIQIPCHNYNLKDSYYVKTNK